MEINKILYTEIGLSICLFDYNKFIFKISWVIKPVILK